jgi:Ca2+-binding EF-hand superfamily protein
MIRFALPALTGLVIAIYVLAPVASPAQQRGPSDDMIKANFMEVLKEADKNRDGKLSMSECLAIWKDKKTGEKNCKYWDADGDGVITEDEYVQQVRKIMRK